MLITFIIAGKGISKDKSHYWIYAFWPAIVLLLYQDCGLIEVMIMFIIWKFIFMIQKISKYCLLHLIISLKIWEQDRIGFYLVFGCFYIGSHVFLRSVKRYAAWVLPLFLISFTVFSEYMIRQSFGYTFVFLFMLFLFKEEMPIYKRYICMFVCFIWPIVYIQPMPLLV